MASIQLHQFEYNDDNYGFLIHDPVSGETAAIDAGSNDAYLGALAQTGWHLSQIWITHHHWDHVDGLNALKAKTGAKVFGPKHSRKPIDGLDVMLGEGDEIDFGASKVKLIETPGHTLDMLNFYLPNAKIIFSGDTLFALGCGRLFEGTPAQMWESMKKLKSLPPQTQIYCSHEYTKTNLAFALSVDPHNEVLIARGKEIEALRAKGKPTVPTDIAAELQANPFLRPDDAQIRKHLDMMDASDEAVFAELRKRKDNF